MNIIVDLIKKYIIRVLGIAAVALCAMIVVTIFSDPVPRRIGLFDLGDMITSKQDHELKGQIIGKGCPKINNNRQSTCHYTIRWNTASYSETTGVREYELMKSGSGW